MSNIFFSCICIKDCALIVDLLLDLSPFARPSPWSCSCIIICCYYIRRSLTVRLILSIFCLFVRSLVYSQSIYRQVSKSMSVIQSISQSVGLLSDHKTSVNHRHRKTFLRTRREISPTLVAASTDHLQQPPIYATHPPNSLLTHPPPTHPRCSAAVYNTACVHATESHSAARSTADQWRGCASIDPLSQFAAFCIDAVRRRWRH